MSSDEEDDEKRKRYDGTGLPDALGRDAADSKGCIVRYKVRR